MAAIIQTRKGTIRVWRKTLWGTGEGRKKSITVEVDVRGLACSIPVVETKKAIEENPKETLAVLVESAVSKEKCDPIGSKQGVYCSSGKRGG